jgi:tetratricopeptide (TPR) repeat protein/tRNA A-37 threonylcarbamoyl transferase component Bud32
LLFWRAQLRPAVRQISEEFLWGEITLLVVVGYNAASTFDTRGNNLIGTLVSRYRIVDKLGSGGMGEVYAAEDTQLRRRVALKLPAQGDESGEFRRRFLREARAASQLTHPNIARIYDFGAAPDGRPFLVMELIQGTSLKTALQKGPLSASESAWIAESVLQALAEAHAHGLVHRDIKPGNVMLAESGELKVLDFGLAKGLAEIGSPAEPDAETAIGDITTIDRAVGTPAYMSPEQIRGSVVDARSDLFSTGALLYECLTGTPPFSGSSHREIFDQIRSVDPLPPSAKNPKLPREWDTVIAKALCKDAERRYQSADEMQAAVQAVALSQSRTLFRRIMRGPATLKWRTAAGLFATVCVIGGGLLLLRAFSIHEPSREAVEWYDRGAVALRDGTYYGAARMLQKAVDLDRDFPLAHARLAEAASELDDGSRASSEMLAALPKGTGSIPGGVPGLYIDAIHRTLVRDFKGAVNEYLQLADRMKGPEKSSVLVDLGRIYEKDNDVEKALATYREAVGVDGQNAAAHLREGILLGRRKDKSYETEMDRAFQLYQTLSNPEGQAEVLYQRGLLLSSVDLPRATAILEQARQMAHAISSEQQEVAATLQLSTVAYLSGDLKSGETLAIDGVERARRSGMNYMAARGLADLGNTQLLKRDYMRAENSYREALDLSRRSGMRRTEARALSGLANIHQTLGDNQAAVQESAAALTYYRGAGFQIEAVLTLLLLARSQRDLGHAADASAAFEQALTAARQISDPARALLAEQGLATVSQNIGRLPQAVKEYERARESAAALNDGDALVRALTARASVLGSLGRFPESQAALEEAARVAAKTTSSRSLEALVLYRRAELALNRGNLSEASKSMREAYQSNALGPQFTQSALCMEGLALARSGRAAAGRQLCEPALRVLLSKSDPFPIAAARMCLSEILIAAGKPAEAIDTLHYVIDWAASAQDYELEWRAWALRAHVLHHRDEENEKLAASKAAKLFGELEWSEDNIRTYEARPDIQMLKRTIQEVVR